ncbi:Uncharacterized protein BWINRA5_03659 [Bacillus mycoides]|uniref:hypothetical protein n=1 Tax=Bacillus mycoides TaxID=1405 RepID=UPI000818125C|nr:hypothetical protein [Bacillus mycoides]QWH01665.1 hypothetical protein EXW52_16360 [Bacillus mycoides]TKI42272.1 hypothetical protein FC700_17315 [Bacillus mycoides]SCB00229.1 Uncharacterized protein BWINRA5_03659 [Bacillus mycoides]
MKKFQSFDGTITMINDFVTGLNEEIGCNKLMSVDNGYGNLINFVVKPNTYFIDYATVVVGDKVTGFYDANAPAPLIFPPQFQAIVMAKYTPHQSVKVDYFNEQLESSDGKLKLNISPSTQILLTNGQFFTGNLVNRNLIAIYSFTTMSIPAQTTPYKIIVLCQK